MSIINFLAARISIKRVRSVFPALPLLYFIARAYFISAETNAVHMEKDTMQQRVFSVAGITENKPPADYIRITFYESARIYKFLKSLPDYNIYLSNLKEAKEKKKPVDITLLSSYSDTIIKVRPVKHKNE
jgi:hypothetical protein